MNAYRVGDAILYRREGYLEPALASVFEKLPNACFAEICVAQYSTPIQVMIRNEDILQVVRAN